MERLFVTLAEMELSEVSATLQSDLLSFLNTQTNICTAGTFTVPAHHAASGALPLDWYDAQSCYIAMGGKPIAPPAELPDTKGLTEAQRFDTYAKFVKDHGTQQAKNALTAGEQVIVGLRMSTNTRANRGQGIYDDRIVVIWTESNPTPTNPHIVLTANKSAPSRNTVIKRAVEFTANTEPSAQYEEPGKVWQEIKSKKTGKMVRAQVAEKIFGPDGRQVIPRMDAKTNVQKIEGDDPRHEGRKALGELVPGTYQFHFGVSVPLRSYVLRGTTDQVVQRDVNHDGSFTPKDVWHTEKGDTVIETGDFAILIHPGGLQNTWSGGCQTIPKPEFQRFLGVIKRKQNNYFYVLVTLR